MSDSKIPRSVEHVCTYTVIYNWELKDRGININVIYVTSKQVNYRVNSNDFNISPFNFNFTLNSVCMCHKSNHLWSKWIETSFSSPLSLDNVMYITLWYMYHTSILNYSRVILKNVACSKITISSHMIDYFYFIVII